MDSEAQYVVAFASAFARVSDLAVMPRSDTHELTGIKLDLDKLNVDKSLDEIRRKTGDRRNVSQFLGEWKLVNVPSPRFFSHRQDLVLTLAAPDRPR